MLPLWSPTKFFQNKMNHLLLKSSRMKDSNSFAGFQMYNRTCEMEDNFVCETTWKWYILLLTHRIILLPWADLFCSNDIKIHIIVEIFVRNLTLHGNSEVHLWTGWEIGKTQLLTPRNILSRSWKALTDGIWTIITLTIYINCFWKHLSFMAQFFVFTTQFTLIITLTHSNIHTKNKHILHFKSTFYYKVTSLLYPQRVLYKFIKQLCTTKYTENQFNSLNQWKITVKTMSIRIGFD